MANLKVRLGIRDEKSTMEECLFSEAIFENSIFESHVNHVTNHFVKVNTNFNDRGTLYQFYQIKGLIEHF